MNTPATFISHQNLLTLLTSVMSCGSELFAPRKIDGKLFLSRITGVDQITLDPQPTIESAKSLLFPRVERLLSYERTSDGVRVDDPSVAHVPERVVFGTRPCDAAGFKRLVEFFAAEIPDAFVGNRRDALTVISMSCSESDADCFCTSVGGGPGDTKGSDILLTAIGDGRYSIECLTDRGEKLLGFHATLLEKGDAIEKAKYLAVVELVEELNGLEGELKKSFDHPFWNEASLRCLGCGACAYVCPVCSCFDIEDEGTASNGERLRCWDSCAFALFTLHTSGHNPRPTQSDRWRQRMMHKFSYEPERLGFPGCVGCGRCSRACPADMNLKEQIREAATRLAVKGAQ